MLVSEPGFWLSVMINRIAASDIDDLVSKYGDSLLRMCFLYLNDIHLAEDAVQDTFLKVYKCYPQFKGDSEVKTWITRIAINVCKNYQRSSWWKHIDVAKSLEKVVADQNPESIQDDTLILEIMKLPYKYKEVILLFYYYDMPIREISLVLNISQSTVSVRLKRAREKLKSRLKGWYYDE